MSPSSQQFFVGRLRLRRGTCVRHNRVITKRRIQSSTLCVCTHVFDTSIYSNVNEERTGRLSERKRRTVGAIAYIYVIYVLGWMYRCQNDCIFSRGLFLSKNREKWKKNIGHETLCFSPHRYLCFFSSFCRSPQNHRISLPLSGIFGRKWYFRKLKIGSTFYGKCRCFKWNSFDPQNEFGPKCDQGQDRVLWTIRNWRSHPESNHSWRFKKK